MRRAAGVARDNQVIVQVPARVNRGGNPDVGGATGNNDRIDAAGAQRQIQISLVKSAPAIFLYVIVVGTRFELRNRFGTLVAPHDVHLPFRDFTVGPRCQRIVGIGQEQGRSHVVWAMIALGKKDQQSGCSFFFYHGDGGGGGGVGARRGLLLASEIG